MLCFLCFYDLFLFKMFYFDLRLGVKLKSRGGALKKMLVGRCHGRLKISGLGSEKLDKNWGLGSEFFEKCWFES